MNRRLNSILIAISAALSIAACESEEGEKFPPKIYFASSGKYEIGPNDTITLKPRVIYDHGTMHKWIVDGKQISDTLELKFWSEIMHDYKLTFITTNDLGSDTFDVSISVLNNIDFTEFDNFEMPEKTGLYMVPNSQNEFITKHAIFSNEINSDTTMWSGFAFSNRINQSQSLSSSAIGCACISSTKSTDYMVVSGYEPGAKVVFDRPYIVRSMDLAADNFSYLVSKYGFVNADSTLIVPYSQMGDHVRMRAYGLDADGNIGKQVSFDLINCEFDNPAKFFRLTDWVTIDMSSLGTVSGIYFECEATQSGFPPFFCIDNLKLQDE